MKNQTLRQDSKRKKRRVLMGLALGGSLAIMAGAGIGVGYVIWHKKSGADPAIKLSADKSHVIKDAEGTTTIECTFDAVNFAVTSLTLVGADATKFDAFTPDYANKTFTVKVHIGTETGDYKLQVQANDDSSLVSNLIPINVDDPAKTVALTLAGELDLDNIDSAVTATVTVTGFTNFADITPAWTLNGDTTTTLNITQDGSWSATGELTFNITNNSQTNTGHFNLICTVGGVSSTPADLNIVNQYVFTPVPVTTTYFNLARTDATNDTVVGFSEAVINDYAGGSSTLLDGFDSIDFQHSPVKYMAANSAFGKASQADTGNVFDTWQIRQLNLSGIKFHFDLSGKSGYNIFQYCNFSSLIELNLSSTDFASCAQTDISSTFTGTLMSAYSTFKGADFSALTTLNLSGAVFATSKMCSSTATGINTANYTFQNATFSALTALNLSGAVFAATNMGAGVIVTADTTFSSATFTALTTLNLSGAVYVAYNTGASYFVSARSTFSSATFTALTTLNLSGAVFATSNVTTGTFYSAHSTFGAAIFSALTTLNLSGAVFATSNATISTFQSASQTFYRIISLQLANLYLPPDQPNQTWYNSFATQPGKLPTSATIHWAAYTASNYPTNWTNSGFPSGWIWTNSMT